MQNKHIVEYKTVQQTISGRSLIAERRTERAAIKNQQESIRNYHAEIVELRHTIDKLKERKL